jgi:putative nucleotide binding protein
MENKNIKEENVIVLDFLPNGYPFDKRPIHKKTPIAQAIGIDHFSMLELVPKKGVFLQPYNKIYVGEGKRDQIHHILGKLTLDKLTGTAKSELNFIINDIIDKNETRFVDFFNKAQPLSTRMHQLELLPGVGKKHMWQIIDERKVEDFKNFADIKSRVKLLPDPKKTIIRRVLSELKGNEKYNLFVDN